MTDNDIINNRQRIEEEIRARMALLEAYKLVEADVESRKVQHQDAAPQRDVVRVAPIPNGSHKVPVQAASKEYGYNSKIVRSAIGNIVGTFSIRTLMDHFRKRGDKITKGEISTVLSRFREKGEIVIVRHGRGRKPAIYKSPSHGGEEGETTDELSTF